MTDGFKELRHYDNSEPDYEGFGYVICSDEKLGYLAYKKTAIYGIDEGGVVRFINPDNYKRFETLKDAKDYCRNNEIAGFTRIELVEKSRELYQKGTRVELVKMDDPQAPPKGTRGTVWAVDDIGSIHVQWDNGSSLSLIYGVDRFNIVTE